MDKEIALDTRAQELAEQYENGNRAHVLEALSEMTPLQAAGTVAAMHEKIRGQSGNHLRFNFWIRQAACK